jgi:hypothetical protein
MTSLYQCQDACLGHCWSRICDPAILFIHPTKFQHFLVSALVAAEQQSHFGESFSRLNEEMTFVECSGRTPGLTFDASGNQPNYRRRWRENILNILRVCERYSHLRGLMIREHGPIVGSRSTISEDSVQKAIAMIRCGAYSTIDQVLKSLDKISMSVEEDKAAGQDEEVRPRVM